MRPLLKFRIFGLQFEVSAPVGAHKTISTTDAKLNIGPGAGWVKPDKSWYCIDADPARGDIPVNFQEFSRLPFNNESVSCVYGSHVFEHISIFKSQIVFNEIHRVLKTNGVFRLIIPDVEKSIKEYVNKNREYKLFVRRRGRAESLYNRDYTLFQCLKEDFLSPSGQQSLLGENALAHQNAWDFEAIVNDLQAAGFRKENIKKMEYRITQSDHFAFEGNIPSEADEDYRSLYIEAVK